jgi:hypothetical protein
MLLVAFLTIRKFIVKMAFKTGICLKNKSKMSKNSDYYRGLYHDCFVKTNEKIDLFCYK